jgi:hypothetical protein
MKRVNREFHVTKIPKIRAKGDIVGDKTSEVRMFRFSSCDAVPPFLTVVITVSVSVVVVITALFFCSSCSMDPEVVSIFGGDIAVPKLVSVEPVSGREIRAVFSSPVTVSGAGVSLQSSAASPEIPSSWEEKTGSGDVSFILEETVALGSRAVLSATVTDPHGNSLSFSVPFTGYNDHPPKLRIQEIRTDYSKPKVEFVELVALTAGNLSGVEIVNAGNAARPSWEFPAVEVKAGDIIVYHLRSVEEGLVNETGAADGSGGVDARPGARDFWDTQAKAPLKDTNVILVRARRGGEILDAVLMAAPGVTDWPSGGAAAGGIAVAARTACEAGAWKGEPTVANAVSSEGMTVTRTLGRNPGAADTDSAADWKLCAKGKSTPGAANAIW